MNFLKMDEIRFVKYHLSFIHQTHHSQNSSFSSCCLIVTPEKEGFNSKTTTKINMATFKALCIVVMLVICSIFAGGVNAKFIDYGVIGKGDPSHCSGRACLPKPSHPYDRGCEKETECRGGRI